jgi:rSAM/selenodomain-associated transferase 2
VISVLIPALNEADYVRSVVRRVAKVLPGHEVLVIDGGSTDATAAAASSEGATVVRSTGSRGSSLNDAARLARGDVLLFLHADTLLPQDTEAEILRVLRDTRVVGGAFRMAFDDPSAVARCIATWVNVRSRLLGVFFGDQAMFVRRQVFLLAGGFRDWSLMEDLEILRRLRRWGRLRIARAESELSAFSH